MKTIGFVGESGSGKSHKAIIVAKSRNIEYIIDDGLFIKGNTILAGISAKKEATRLASVKRALFVDLEHTKQVSDEIIKQNPNQILILGTSNEMIDTIANALLLPKPSEIINISDVATKEEIEKAKKIRIKEGKHVVPVPTFEVKKHFSGYFIDSLKIFKKGKDREITFVADKSIVRPTFSYLGEYYIKERVIFDLSVFEAEKIEGVCRVNKTVIKSYPDGIEINIDVTLKYGIIIYEVCNLVIENIKKSIYDHASINVKKVFVYVKTLEK